MRTHNKRMHADSRALAFDLSRWCQSSLSRHIVILPAAVGDPQRWGDLTKTKQNELFIIKYPMAPRP